MITSNALGHFVHSRNIAAMLEDKEKIQALEHAMRTIGNAHRSTGRGKLKHCPATFLIPIGNGENTPLREGSDFRKYSPDHYQGYFHTDHLIPSVFFSKGKRSERTKVVRGSYFPIYL